MDHTNGSDSAVSRWLGPLYAVWCELHYENGQMFFLPRTLSLQYFMCSHQHHQQYHHHHQPYLLLLPGPPVNVTCNIFINSFGSITETTMVRFFLFSSLNQFTNCNQQFNICFLSSHIWAWSCSWVHPVKGEFVLSCDCRIRVWLGVPVTV